MVIFVAVSYFCNDSRKSCIKSPFFHKSFGKDFPMHFPMAYSQIILARDWTNSPLILVSPRSED
jgi:hypothetical protein